MSTGGEIQPASDEEEEQPPPAPAHPAYAPGDFRQWLLARRCEAGVHPTHTSIDKPKGRFHVTSEDEAEFLRLYAEALNAREDLHLTEKPGQWSPMRFDFDLRFAAPPPPSVPLAEGETRPPPPRTYVRDNHIRRIVHAASRILAEYTAPGDGADDVLRAYVMEKPAPVEVRNVIKDGVHLMYPGCVTETPFQFFVREKLLPSIPDILGDLGVTNPWTDVIDDKIIELNNWQLYGSRKPGYTTYTVSVVYDYDRANDTLTEVPVPPTDVALLRRLTVRGRVPADGCRFIDGANGQEVREWIQRIYPSVAGRKRDALNQQVFAPTTNRSRNQVSDEELTMVRKLTIDCLSAERAEAYDTWVRVGWALRNVDHRLLDTWIVFSKLSSKYVEGECEKKWSKMRMDGTLGIGSIRYWARQDDAATYKRIMDDSLQILVDRCIRSKGNAHFDIALVVQNMFKDQFVAVGRNRWFFFNARAHRWDSNMEGQKIRLYLSTDISSKFIDRANYYTMRHSASAANMNAEAVEAGVPLDERAGIPAQDDANIKVLLDIANKLRQATFKVSVLKECETLITDEKFEDKLDSKPHLLGFNNGVYDLSLREFRDGQPDDYISYTTGINYVPYDPNSSVADEIRRFFRTVHRNPAVERYQWDILASALDGGAKSEKFYVMSGNGCFAPGTEVRMFDGSVKTVENVVVGDRLMGDDSTPRNVLQLFAGEDEMYRIVPNKGEPFVVNANHDMVLKMTNLTRIFQAKNATRVKGTTESVCKWTVHWPERHVERIYYVHSRTFNTELDARRHLAQVESQPSFLHKGDVVQATVQKLLDNWDAVKNGMATLYMLGADYPERPVDFDPHFIGIWLGDGSSRDCEVTTMDPEIVDYMRKIIGPDHELCPRATKGKATTYSIVSKSTKQGTNKFREALKTYDLFNNKHIPVEYKINSREVRLAVLAGLLDTDGHYQAAMGQYELTLKSEALLDDAIEVARSLGFTAYKHEIQKKCYNSPTQAIGTYYRTNIYGVGMEDIPVLLAYKRAKPRTISRDASVIGFEMESLGKGQFFGFELDANRRFLLATYFAVKNSNGKSRLVELVQRAFGDYATVLPVTVLTSKRVGTGGASPEIVRIKGRRFVISQEPGENERLSVGVMKEISGGDDIIARGLYRDSVQFKPMCKLFLTCNELPSVGGVEDGGTWRRIRLINFASKFVVDPDPNNPNELLLDPDLMQRFPTWSETFMSMLLDHYGRIDVGKIHEPKEVTIATEKYKMNNDLLGQFISETLKPDPLCKVRVKIMQVFQHLRTWWSMNSKQPCPSMPTVKDVLERKLGSKYVDKGWAGYRFVPPSKADDEEEEEEAEEAPPTPAREEEEEA